MAGKELDTGTRLRAEKLNEATREETILEKAERIVMGDREKRYGPPKENHTCTAAMWNAYLDRRKKAATNKTGADFYNITPEDVCFLNILQKVSRCANTITKDNLADMAGWARCVERIMDEPKVDIKITYDNDTLHPFITGIVGGTICERCHGAAEHPIHNVGKSA